MFMHRLIQYTTVSLALMGAHVTFSQTNGVPSVVMSDHQLVYNGPTGGTYGIAANAQGDIFFADPIGKFIDMLPYGTTAPVVLLKNVSGTPHSVMVDKAGNVFAPNTIDGKVIRIPFVNGAYPTNVDYTTLSSAFCTANATTDCRLPAFGTVTGNYARIADLAVDGAGNYYLVDINDNVSTGTYTRILKQTPAGVDTIVVDHLPVADNAQIASDAAGNLYYSDGASLYSIPAGSSTATVMNASTLNKPSGVRLDPYGNLLVSDYGNSRIVVMPYINGALDFTKQYLLAPYYTKNNVGIDARGTIYYAGSGNNNINALQSSVYNVPSLAVGASSTSAFVYASFNATTTFTQYLTRGYGATINYVVGTCVIGTTYTTNQSCAFNASIKPSRVGATSGTIGIADGSGNFLSQFTLAATALGSAVTIDPGTPASIASGFTNPAGVAVDLAGNVFVADTANNAVYELVGGTGTPVALGTGLSAPTGVAVDSTGNLFVADSGNARVVEIPIVGSTLMPAQQRVIASGLAKPIVIATGPYNSLYVAQAGSLVRYENRDYTLPVQTATIASIVSPGALAVDATGNVFVADKATGKIDEYDAYSYALGSKNIATGFTVVTGLAVDAAGNLFVVDSGTAQATRIPNIAGVLTPAQSVSVGTFTSPFGLAIDGGSNLYVTDPSVPAAYKIARTTGLVNFGNVSQGTTSSVTSASLVSSGNQTLTLGTPLDTASGDTTHFALNPATTCAAAQTLAAGSSCSLAATFSPSAKGVTSEVLAINAAPTVTTSLFNLTLTGNGTYQVPTTLSVAPAQSGAISYGQPVTFIATLTPSQFNVAAAGGMVTFSINGVLQKPVALGGNTASITVAALPGGSNSVSATYSGDLNYSASLAPTILVNVTLASTTTSLTIAASYANPTSSLAGGNVVLTAAVTPSIAGQLDGTVNFVSGGNVLGSATLTLTSGSVYQAVLSTTTISVGTYSVTAVYLGNTNYTTSTSSASPLIVGPASIQLTSSSSDIVSTPTVPGSVTLSVASVSGLGGTSSTPVSFFCSGLPTYATCIFAPAYVSLAASPASAPIAPQQVLLTIKVNVQPTTPLPPVSSIFGGKGTETMLAMFLCAPLLMRRKFRRLFKGVLALFLLALFAVAGISGCGSNTTLSTPLGTTPITVTAFSSSVTTSITLNLTVKN